MDKKSDISDRTSEVSRLRLFICLLHGRWIALRPIRGHPTPKMEITLFYHKLDAEYFFNQQFFWKKAVFSKKTENLFGGGAHLTIL